MIEKTTVQKILYGAVRNENHFKIRRKGYIRSSIRIIYDLVFLRKTKKVHFDSIILNLISEKFLDLNNIKFSQKVLYSKMDIRNPYFRKLFLIELGLYLGFVFNNDFFHKYLFYHLEKYGNKYITENNLIAIICGPSTLLTTFLGVLLKRRNRPVILFQHGIYQIQSYKVEWYEKNVMSKILVWGDLYKKLYVDQNVLPSKVEVIAPYFQKLFEDEEKIEEDNFYEIKSVLFIGQQLNKISKEVFEPYNSFIETLVNVYEEKGVEVTYKAHPREVIKDTLNSTNIERLKFFSSESLDDFEIFYSVNSTLLVEMYLKKKICFQVGIQIPDLPYDKFYLYSGIPLIKPEDLDAHLNYKEYCFWIEPNYLNFWKADYKERIADKVYHLILESNTFNHERKE